MSDERTVEKKETYLTEVRGLDGLATLGFTSSGDLYIDASRRGGDERMSRPMCD